MQSFRGIRLILLMLVLWVVNSGCKNTKSTIETTPLPLPILPSNTALDTNVIHSSNFTQSPPISNPTRGSFTPQVVQSSTSTPASTPDTGRAHTLYDLNVTLDYAAHSLSVEEHVSFLNRTHISLTNIPMVIEAARYPGAFHLDSLFWEDGSRITQYQLRGIRLTLNPPLPVLPSETVRFSLSYTLKLPLTTKLENIRPYPFGYTNYQANLGDWYPFIPSFDEQKGWLIHDPGFYGEHLVYDIADFAVDIHLIGEQTDLILAASASEQKEEDHIHYYHPDARNFAWSASPYYQVISQSVAIDGASPVSVNSYFFPFYEKAGERANRTISQALPLYSQLFGIEYTHSQLTVVQADFLDGMEYDGLFFLGKDFYNWYNGSSQDFLVALSAHETAHQWFYGLVGNDQALNPWLDEALCTYSERLFYENLIPESLDWWWTYRVDYYQPKGFVDTTIFDTPQVSGQYRAYRDAVYLNGALFLEELRKQIGDQAFDNALQSYLSQYSYAQGTPEGFFAAIRQFSNVNLEPLLEQYFFHKQVYSSP